MMLSSKLARFLSTKAATLPRVGWIGAGVMGSFMCGHVLDKGFDVTLYSRTRSKCEDLEACGARVVDTPAEVAEASDIICSIVGFPRDVEAVLLGPEGVIQNASSNAVVVDLTTSAPALAARINTEAERHNVFALDAPVSGGDIGARNGTLSIMTGGSEAAFARASPVLECFGKTIKLMGPAGAGQHTKMVNQIVIATNMIGMCEGLLYAHAAGLDASQVIEAISPGAAGSWSLSNLAPRVVNRDFRPGFFVEHFIKDLGIALTEASAMGLSLPGLALSHQLYLAVQAQGYGRKGTHALMRALESLNGKSTS